MGRSPLGASCSEGAHRPPGAIYEHCAKHRFFVLSGGHFIVFALDCMTLPKQLNIDDVLE